MAASHRRGQRTNQLIPFMDIAYQGFGDGLDGRVRHSRHDRSRRELPAEQLVLKNLSLYGERCGLSVICQNAEEANRVLGQMKFTVRRNCSSPPTHGGQV